jgi:predicted ArsR family transcriptional regulator
MENVTESAKSYYQDDGWNVIPIRENGKTPTVRDLNKILLFPETEEEIQEYFPDNHRNIAVAAGPVSGNNGSLTVLDFEYTGMPEYERLLFSNPTFQRIADNTRVSKTQSGGRHVFIETEDPIRGLSISEDDRHVLDLKGFKGYGLVPPSKIKSPYLWENPEALTSPIYKASIEELQEILSLWGKQVQTVSQDAIAAELAKYQLKQSRAIEKGILSKRLFIYLVSGVWPYSDLRKKDGSPDRSRIEYKIIYRLVAMGFSGPQIRETFQLYAYNGSKAKTSTKFPFLNVAIEKAFKEYQKRKSEVDRHIEDLIPAIRYNTDLSIMERTTAEGILHICKQVNRFENLYLPQRELAEIAGVSSETIRRHLKSLNRKGIIELLKPTTGTKPALFNFNQKVSKIPTHTYTPRPGGTIGMATNLTKSEKEGKSPDFSQIGNDAFHRYGLGKTGKYIVDLFNENPGKRFEVKEIAQKSGISKPTVIKKLEELIRYNLLKCEKIKPEKGRPRKVYWIEEEIRDLSRIAVAKGTAGAGKKRKKRHEKERKDYYEILKIRAVEYAKAHGGEIPKGYAFLFRSENEEN